MTEPKLHHVVFCVRPENQDAATQLWRDMGVAFEELALEEEGLRVLLAWTAGIEIIAPTPAGGTETGRFRSFLDERGEGIYSVVVRTDDVDGPVSVATRHGSTENYRQHRELDGIVVDEVDMTPVHGMAFTFLATNLPD